MKAAGPIYLVRHGEAAASWGESADPPLSELGREQAHAVARTLTAGEVTPDLLVSSPLKRARETAQPLSEALSLSVSVDECFREIPSPVPLSERQDWLRQFMRERWEMQGPLLWGWRDAMLAALDELPPNTVIFTHFLVINTIVGALEREQRTLIFWPANASVTTLERCADELSVRALGESMRSKVN